MLLFIVVSVCVESLNSHKRSLFGVPWLLSLPRSSTTAPTASFSLFPSSLLRPTLFHLLRFLFAAGEFSSLWWIWLGWYVFWWTLMCLCCFHLLYCFCAVFPSGLAVLSFWSLLRIAMEVIRVGICCWWLKKCFFIWFFSWVCASSRRICH